jgi:hypothetical protein
MELKALNDRFRLLIGRTPQDAEKAVTPTIIWINTNHPSFEEVRHRGFMIIIGWWDWSIKVGLVY